MFYEQYGDMPFKYVQVQPINRFLRYLLIILLLQRYSSVEGNGRNKSHKKQFLSKTCDNIILGPETLDTEKKRKVKKASKQTGEGADRKQF